MRVTTLSIQNDVGCRFVILRGAKELDERKGALRFFAELVLSVTTRPFVSLRVTKRRDQHDKSGMWQGKR
jgi:hypothetical protein